MARVEDIDRHNSETNRRLKVQEKELIAKYGGFIGSAALDYLHGGDDSIEVFAESVVKQFETGTHEDKVKAISALLEIVNIKTEGLSRRIEKTELNNALF